MNMATMATDEARELPLALAVAGHFPHLPPGPKPTNEPIVYRQPTIMQAEAGRGHNLHTQRVAVPDAPKVGTVMGCWRVVAVIAIAKFGKSTKLRLRLACTKCKYQRECLETFLRAKGACPGCGGT